MGKDLEGSCCEACKMFSGDEPVQVVRPAAPLLAERAGIRIAWTDREGIERSFVPTGPEVRVGRGKDNDIVILDSALSRRQCRFRFDEGQVIVEDMRSTCGTYLDGEKVGSGVVRDGSVVFIGDTRLRITRTRSR